jgi:hypothetical protein
MAIYYVDEEMLGSNATESDARKMIDLLRERGYDARYGRDHDGDIPDDVWDALLGQIAIPADAEN